MLNLRECTATAPAAECGRVREFCAGLGITQAVLPNTGLLFRAQRKLIALSTLHSRCCAVHSLSLTYK